MEIAALRSLTWIGDRFGVVRPGGDSSNRPNFGRGSRGPRPTGRSAGGRRAASRIGRGSRSGHLRAPAMTDLHPVRAVRADGRRAQPHLGGLVLPGFHHTRLCPASPLPSTVRIGSPAPFFTTTLTPSVSSSSQSLDPSTVAQKRDRQSIHSSAPKRHPTPNLSIAFDSAIVGESSVTTGRVTDPRDTYLWND